MTVPALSPIQAYALRLTLFGAGKTIFHHERLCEIAESHQSIRLLLPLINADLTTASPITFWVPRRPVSRRRFTRERTEWQYRTGIKKAFLQPCWTGDARPDKETAQLRSDFPETNYLAHLVKDLGYPIEAALAAMSHGHVWRDPRPDRRHNGTTLVQHPYNPVAPNRRTTQGGGFSRAQVLSAIARMRTDNNTRFACFEVVYRRRSPKVVARQHGIEWGKLRTYATRVRQRIRGGGKVVQKANKSAGLEAVVYTDCP
jgi:hypothetical protein